MNPAPPHSNNGHGPAGCKHNLVPAGAPGLPYHYNGPIQLVVIQETVSLTPNLPIVKTSPRSKSNTSIQAKLFMIFTSNKIATMLRNDQLNITIIHNKYIMTTCWGFHAKLIFKCCVCPRAPAKQPAVPRPNLAATGPTHMRGTHHETHHLISGLGNHATRALSYSWGIDTTTWWCRKLISQWQCSFHLRAVLQLVKRLVTASDHSSSTGPNVVSLVKKR